MELRELWGIVWRRLWVVIGLVLVALLASLFLAQRTAPTYQARVSLAVKPSIEPRTATYYGYDEYYAYAASEYLVDDLMEVIEGGAFMADIRAKLAQRPGGPPSGSIEASKTHRVLTLTVTAPTDRDALDIAKAAAELLSEPNSVYFQRLSQQKPMVTVVDPSALTATSNANRRYLDLGLRTLLGLLVGLGLAFLLDYLDNTVRGRREVETLLGLAVLGEIPPERRFGLGRRAP